MSRSQPRNDRKAEPKKDVAAPPVRAGYHHGALREALLQASESLLAERGVEGFSLREVARRSGVSPAAPAHHFGDAAGLLTAVATLAFDGLTAALEAGNVRGGGDPVTRLREQGVGYVGFALQHPGRFRLMFSGGLHDDPALLASAHAAFMALERAVRRLLGAPEGPALTALQRQSLVAIWSTVHGFAHLALSGQLRAGLPAGCRAPSPAAYVDLLRPLLQQQLQAWRPTGSQSPRTQRSRPQP